MKKTHRSEFLKIIKEKFPEITDRINQENGLLTFEVSVFIGFIQRKIDAGEVIKTKECLDLLGHHYSSGNKALSHTIRNAVCEDLIFDDSTHTNRSWALEILPVSLKAERDSWLQFMGYSK